MKYRVFTNDVGPHSYSGLKDVVAVNISEAKKYALKAAPFGCKVLVLPHSLRSLWPDKFTGAIDGTAVKPYFARFQ